MNNARLILTCGISNKFHASRLDSPTLPRVHLTSAIGCASGQIDIISLRKVISTSKVTIKKRTNGICQDSSLLIVPGNHKTALASSASTLPRSYSPGPRVALLDFIGLLKIKKM